MVSGDPVAHPLPRNGVNAHADPCTTRLQAPGEAEAELAMLSRRNEIDLIITDDADSFLFGAQSVRAYPIPTSAALLPS